jgi:hypothetical protein
MIIIILFLSMRRSGVGDDDAHWLKTCFPEFEREVYKHLNNIFPADIL